MHTKTIIYMLAIAALTPRLTQAQSSSPSTSNSIPVTVDNFNRAETDMYFAESVKLAGGLGRFHHNREIMPIEKQTVIRANRDTLYSAAVFDLDAGPVTVILPDPQGRFLSMIVIDEDQYALETVYAPGTFTYSRDKVGTRYVLLSVMAWSVPSDIWPHDDLRQRRLFNVRCQYQVSSGMSCSPIMRRVPSSYCARIARRPGSSAFNTSILDWSLPL